MYVEKLMNQVLKRKKKFPKPAKYVSLESSDDPYTVTFEAIELVENKKRAMPKADSSFSWGHEGLMGGTAILQTVRKMQKFQRIAIP